MLLSEPMGATSVRLAVRGGGEFQLGLKLTAVHSGTSHNIKNAIRPSI